jgi:hypothetical protein
LVDDQHNIDVDGFCDLQGINDIRRRPKHAGKWDPRIHEDNFVFKNETIEKTLMNS